MPESSVAPRRRLRRLRCRLDLPLALLALLALVLAPLAGGCAFVSSPTFANGTVARAEGYEVRSDAPAEVVRAHVALIERDSPALERFFGTQGDSTTTVCIFRDQESYSRFLSSYRSAFSGLDWEVLESSRGSHSAVLDEILFYADRPEPEVLRHELTHRFIARARPDARPWLHEGLATYIETLPLRRGRVRLLIRPEIVLEARDLRARGEGMDLRKLAGDSFNAFYTSPSARPLATALVAFLLHRWPPVASASELFARADALEAYPDRFEKAFGRWLDRFPAAEELEELLRRAPDEPRIFAAIPTMLDLGHLGPERERTLALLSRDRDPAVRRVSLFFVAARSRPEDRPVLESALDDDEAGVRHVAAVSLGRLGDRRVVRRLIDALRDPPIRLSLGLGVGAERAVLRLDVLAVLEQLTGFRTPSDGPRRTGGAVPAEVIEAWEAYYRQNYASLPAQL